MATDGVWTKITVTTGHEAVEAVTGIFMSFGINGVEILDPKDWEKAADGAWRYGEIFPERASWDLKPQIEIAGYMAGDHRDAQIIDEIKKQVESLKKLGLDSGPALIQTMLVVDSDWADGWKAFYHTQKIGQRIVIRPSWESYVPEKDDIVLTMDPGMAFGTGEHATTRLCLLQLEQLVKKGQTVFDVGCGSGILSLAAAGLGAAKVQACDVDPVAVRVARENAELNGLEDTITVHPGPIEMFRDQANVIVANIIADVIIEILPAVVQRLETGGYFVAGGIVSEHEDRVLSAHANAGLKVIHREAAHDWLCLVSEL